MGPVKMDDEDKSKWEWNQKDTSPVSQSGRWKMVGGWPNFPYKLWPWMFFCFDLISQHRSRCGLIRQLVDEWFHRTWFKGKVRIRKTLLGVRSTSNLEAPRLLKATGWQLKRWTPRSSHTWVPESIQQKPERLWWKMSLIWMELNPIE